MEILSRRERIKETERVRSFSWNDCPGAGFSFECDEDGNVDVAALPPEAIDNYNGCISGTFDVTDEGIRVREWFWTKPAVGKCVCGSKVELDGFTNTCRCGRDYNSCGQLLGPRSQWGEETGESLADILRIP